MSATCRPCLSLVPPNPCPDLFSGGTIPTPIPTRQRVCNTEQTASCPDGSNPVIIPAGTFCTVVLNPTATSIATTQAAMDAQALAQAQSEVGDCAWNDIVWGTAIINVFGGAGITVSGVGLHGDFDARASDHATNTGTKGILLQGDINFNYKVGTVTHHNISGRFVNNSSPPGTGIGVFQSQITLQSGINFGALVTLFTESHAGVPGLGTYDFSFDFASPGTTPLVYRISASTTVYDEAVFDHVQTLIGSVKALD